jgi:hypothetical protein
MPNLLQGLKTKGLMVPPDMIIVNLYVRKELSQDHCMYLACLLDDADDPVALEPIVVIPEFEDRTDDVLHFIQGSDKYVLVYGRHRLWALDKILDRSEVKVLVILEGITTKSELISLAYRENTGGSLPPTNADTEHTIEELLKLKASKKKIADMLGLPPGLARKFVNNVESRLERAKVNRVLRKVAEESITIVEAAREEGVDPGKVRRKMVTGAGPDVNGNEDADMVRREVSNTYKSLASKNASRFRSLLEKYDDGDVNAKFVFDVFRQIEDLQNRSRTATAEWRKRFEAKVSHASKKR